MRVQIIIALVPILLDLYKYPGFFARIVGVDSRLILLVCLVWWVYQRVRRGITDQLVGKISTITLVFTFAFMLTLTLLEILHAPNYVFTTLHLHYDHSFYLFVLNLALVLINQSDRFFGRHGRLLIATVPLFIWGVGLVIRTWPQDFFLVNIQEDQLAEQVQFALLIVSVYFVGRATILTRSNWMQRALLLGATFGLIFVAGEEISWGQRLLGIDTPPSIAASNTQGEITLHNNEAIIDYVDNGYIIFGIVGAFGWAILGKHKFLGLYLPPKELLLYYLLPAAFIFRTNYISRAKNEWREFFELILMLGIMLSAIYIKQRVNASVHSASRTHTLRK